MLYRTAIALLVLTSTSLAAKAVRAEETARHPEQAASKSWIFDQGVYTNDPKTGQRVWQYAPPKAAYRDPNALYDSPHGSYPFAPDVYDPYTWYRPYPYGLPPFYPHHLPPLYGLPLNNLPPFVGPPARGMPSPSMP